MARASKNDEKVEGGFTAPLPSDADTEETTAEATDFETEVHTEDYEDEGGPVVNPGVNPMAREWAENISPTTAQDDPDKPQDIEQSPDFPEDTDAAVAKILAAEDRIAQDKAARGEFPGQAPVPNVQNVPEPSEPFHGGKDSQDPYFIQAEMMRQLADSVMRLSAEVREMRLKQGTLTSGAPTIAPGALTNPSTEGALGAADSRGTHTGATTLATGPNGRRVPEEIMRHFKHPYEQGQYVRINPEAVPWGAENETYGDRLTEEKLSTVGTIRKLLQLGKNGEWKYQVHFPGLTRGDGKGFYDYELVPA